jgi:hypothetical protein
LGVEESNEQHQAEKLSLKYPHQGFSAKNGPSVL